jgi:hypothetical protein
MGLYEGRGQLGKLMKDLVNRWRETRCNWDDKQAHDFEDRYIVPIEMDIRLATSAMDQMAALISTIKQNCT